MNSRALADCFINYSDLADVPSSVPRNLVTGETLSKDDFNMILASNNVWTTKVERDAMIANYNDVIFPEYHICGHHDVTAGKAGKIVFPIDAKGAINFFVLIAQEKKNIDNNWTNFSSSDGVDLIEQFNIITGNVAHEDSLPAVVQRGKFVEIFGKKPVGCMYLQSYCNDGRSISGHLNFTNVDKQTCAVMLKDHPDLHLTLVCGSYNAWWTELGQGGKVWA